MAVPHACRDFLYKQHVFRLYVQHIAHRVVWCWLVECNSLHKVTTLVVVLQIIGYAQIISNDCCSSIQAIV